MSVESWLQERNRRINNMREEMLIEAYGHQVQGGSSSWWRRNQVKLVMYSLLIVSLIACYALGFGMATKVVGIITILAGAQLIWRGIKKLYNIVKTYYLARKLLKQI